MVQQKRYPQQLENWAQKISSHHKTSYLLKLFETNVTRFVIIILRFSYLYISPNFQGVLEDFLEF